MKNTFAILFVFVLSACATVPISSSPEPPVSFETAPTLAPEVPETQVPAQSIYTSTKYGYSLSYPGTLNVVVVSDEYVEIGEKITVEVMNVDPTAPRGDGAVIETISDTQVSGYPAKLLTGYIGSVGGYIPQQFRKVVVERNGSYFVVTLYALGLHVTDGDLSKIAELAMVDISLFDNVTASMQIP